MNLADRIREWLGINEALRATRLNRDLLLTISERLGDVQQNVRTANTKLGILNQGVGRIIAKADPHFIRNPLSPDMKAESDAISEHEIERIKREDALAREAERVLAAEQAVREQYGYTPKEG